MKSNLTHSRTCVFNCNYHIVFSTKYRRRILTPDIARTLKDIVHEKIANIRMDFIHKLTHELVSDSQADLFCVEDLKIQSGMDRKESD